MFNLLLFLLICFCTTLKKVDFVFVFHFLKFHIKIVKFLQAKIVFFSPCLGFCMLRDSGRFRWVYGTLALVPFLGVCTPSTCYRSLWWGSSTFRNSICLNESRVQPLHQILHSELYCSRTPSILLTGTFCIGAARLLFISNRPDTSGKSLKLACSGKVMGSGQVIKRPSRAHWEFIPPPHSGAIICAVVKLCLSYS